MPHPQSTLLPADQPHDYFTGIGQASLPTPVSILLFVRRHVQQLQQKALQNRSHHRHVLIFNLATPGHVHLDNRVLPLQPGQSILIHPFQFHHYSRLEATSLQWLFCTFELGGTSFLDCLRNRVLDTDNDIRSAINELLCNWHHGTQTQWSTGQQTELLQSSLLGLLLVLKKAQSPSPTPPASPHTNDILRSVNRLISNWTSRPVVIDDIASELRVSPSRLRALFKSTAGVPLGSYLLNYRLTRAMALLRTSNLTIAEVAEEAGFGSPQAFSRVFKQKTGLTPRAYRHN